MTTDMEDRFVRARAQGITMDYYIGEGLAGCVQDNPEKYMPYVLRALADNIFDAVGLSINFDLTTKLELKGGDI